MRRTLVPERENLLSLLLEYIHTVATNFSAGPQGNEVLDLPPVVNNIYWARQLEYKVCIDLTRKFPLLKKCLLNKPFLFYLIHSSWKLKRQVPKF